MSRKKQHQVLGPMSEATRDNGVVLPDRNTSDSRNWMAKRQSP
jgi:hypothetical protein